jgi:hypothetical protein
MTGLLEHEDGGRRKKKKINSFIQILCNSKYIT